VSDVKLSTDEWGENANANFAICISTFATGFGGQVGAQPSQQLVNCY
jgi:hypothetical protein